MNRFSFPEWMKKSGDGYGSGNGDGSGFGSDNGSGFGYGDRPSGKVMVMK